MQVVPYVGVFVNSNIVFLRRFINDLIYLMKYPRRPQPSLYPPKR